jgi:hypothetical protein
MSVELLNLSGIPQEVNIFLTQHSQDGTKQVIRVQGQGSRVQSPEISALQKPIQTSKRSY